MSRCTEIIPDDGPRRDWKRCTNTAEVWLLNNEGKDTPGGYMCVKCANDCITEYREKLGWHWSTRPLTEDEKY